MQEGVREPRLILGLPPMQLVEWDVQRPSIGSGEREELAGVERPREGAQGGCDDAEVQSALRTND